MEGRVAKTLAGFLFLLALSCLPTVWCERPVEKAGSLLLEGSAGGAGAREEEGAVSEGGVALSLEKAREASKSWVCGDRTEFYYIFANARSGSNWGERLIREKTRNSRILGDRCAEIHVTAMNDADAFKEAIGDLRDRVETLATLLKDWKSPERGTLARRSKMRLVRVISVGGDGSFTWVVETAQNAGVDLRFLVFGVLPVGTGNDLAHSFGWASFSPPAGDPLSEESLGALVDAWRSARPVQHDIWEAQVSVDSKTGFFDQWNSALQTRTPLGDDHRGPAHLKRFVMTNYFGVGFDGQVGTDFDRFRGRSRAFNRFLYLLLFLKNWPKPKVPVCDRVDTIFKLGEKPVALVSSGDKYRKVPRLESCVSFTFQNIQTISGGIGLWAASERVGLLPPPDESAKAHFEKYADSLSRQHIRCGDGLIQLFTMESASDYSTFLIAPENKAKKVLQSDGPLFVTFKKTDPSAPAESVERLTPFQVDGEFYRAVDIRWIKIENKHTVNVLYRQQQ